MPIVRIEIVGDARARLAQALADRLGDLFQVAPGRVWVSIHRIAVADYAENQTPSPVQPVFVSVLVRRYPESGLADLAYAIAEVVGALCERPVDHVHVLFEPPAAGRIAFGGRLLE